MTRNRDFKQLVRARSAKTGESYTASRQQLLRKRNVPSAEPEPAAMPARRASAPALDVSKAGMTDAVIQAKTGRTWAEWVATLDAAGAAHLPHRDIAAHVHGLGVGDWWSQAVTVGYERIRGLRDVGQRRGGGYEVSKSKTLPVPVATLYRAFADTRTRNRWLPGVAFTIRTATRDKSMRVTWGDGSNLQLMFAAKDAGRSVVAVQHGKLSTRDDADRVRAFWTARLESLAALLGASRPGARPSTRKR